MKSANSNKIPGSYLRAFAYVVGRVRISIIMLTAGTLLLLCDQGRDLLIAIVEDKAEKRFALALTLWALSIWLWDRMLLNIRFPYPPTAVLDYNKWRRWMPRILGGLVYIAAAVAILNAGPVATPLLYWLSVGVIFLLGTWKRRPTGQKFAKRIRTLPTTSSLMLRLAALLDSPEISDKSEPPYETWLESLIGQQGVTWGQAFSSVRGLLAFAFMSFGVSLGIGSLFWPVETGSIGAAQIFLLWSITLLPFGSFISYYADMKSWPLLTFFAGLAVISSFFNDNHEIRPTENNRDVSTRKNVTKALVEWGKANLTDTGKPAPFVVVATAGGGIRAAYWTGTVLGTLHDDIPAFDRQLFAISGVSGGSLGATAYRALISFPSGFPDSCMNKATDCLQQILGQNFLGPVAAGMLYPDLLQRFIPFPVLPDRGEALEKSWEAAFSSVVKDDKHGLNESLASLSDQPPIWPSLFLNATWVENGRRIVASNLRFDSELGPEKKAFARSNDQLAVLGRDIRLSTAAHNSSRFPFISPPGMWKNEDGNIAGRLQDGGLFENYGAETAMEIIDLACSVFACNNQCPQSDQNSQQGLMAITPIVILISSDPSLKEDLSKSPQREPIRFAYEVRTTLTTYEHARCGRGAEAAVRLQEMAKRYGGDFFHFRMCEDSSGPPPFGMGSFK